MISGCRAHDRKILKDLSLLNMVVIVNVIRNGLLGIMTDGFLPEFEILKTRYKEYKERLIQRNHSAIYMKGYHRLERIARFSTVSEKNFLSFYNDFSMFLQNHTCKIQRVSDKPCHYTFYCSSNQVKSFVYQTTHIKKCIQILDKEHKADRKHYSKCSIENLAIFSLDPNHHCCDMISCYENILKPTGFVDKRQEDYLNYSAFKTAWVTILNEMLRQFRFWL